MGIMDWLRKALSMEPQPTIKHEEVEPWEPVELRNVFDIPKAPAGKSPEEWEAIRQQQIDIHLIRMFKDSRSWLEGVTRFASKDAFDIPGFITSNGDIHFDMGSDNRLTVTVEKDQTWDDVRAILATATDAGAAWPWDEMPENISVFVMKADQVAKERAKSEIQPEPREDILKDFDPDYNEIAMLPEPNPHAGECQIEAYREATKDDASIQDRVRDWRRDNPYVQTVTVDQSLDIIERSYAEEEAYSFNEQRNQLIADLKRDYGWVIKDRGPYSVDVAVAGKILEMPWGNAFEIHGDSDFRINLVIQPGQTWDDIDAILATATDGGQWRYWRDIPEFPNYEITGSGAIRNKKTRHILKWNGYKDGQVNLYRSGHKHHRTVAHILTRVWADNYLTASTGVNGVSDVQKTFPEVHILDKE
jgi:hypothetical protein